MMTRSGSDSGTLNHAEPINRLVDEIKTPPARDWFATDRTGVGETIVPDCNAVSQRGH